MLRFRRADLLLVTQICENEEEWTKSVSQKDSSE